MNEKLFHNKKTTYKVKEFDPNIHINYFIRLLALLLLFNMAIKQELKAQPKHNIYLYGYTYCDAVPGCEPYEEAGWINEDFYYKISSCGSISPEFLSSNPELFLENINKDIFIRYQGSSQYVCYPRSHIALNNSEAMFEIDFNDPSFEFGVVYFVGNGNESAPGYCVNSWYFGWAVLSYGISHPQPTSIGFSGRSDYVVEGTEGNLTTNITDDEKYSSEFWYKYEGEVNWTKITSETFKIENPNNSDNIFFRSRIKRIDVPENPVSYSPYSEASFKILKLPSITFTTQPETIICKDDFSTVAFNTGNFNNPEIAFVNIKYTKKGEPVGVDLGTFGEDIRRSINLAEGTYTFVTNFLDSNNSIIGYKEIEITISNEGKEPPTIINHPSDNTVCLGSSANFTVTANGYNISGYSWSKDGGNFISGTSNYSIPITAFTDSGFYRVKVSNECGDIVSNEFKLTVNEPSTVNSGDLINTCESSNPEAIQLSGASFDGGATAAQWSIISGEGNLYTDFTDKPDTVSFVPSADFSGEVTLRLTTNNETGCSPASADRIISVNPSPTNQALTPVGNHCYSESGVEIKLTGSQKGVSYQLKRDGNNAGFLVNGTDSGISFGTHRDVGVYSVVATNILTNCERIMTNTITINPLPQIFSVGGGGSYCAGGNGVEITLADSETDVNYQLVRGVNDFVSSVPGTENKITFGSHKVAGDYKVVATNTATNCSVTMAGIATVTVNPLPQIFNVTGGGSYCEGGEGVEISLSGSQTNVSYSLLDNTNTVKSIIAGTGSIISFGKIQDIGSYTVEVANNSSGCTSIMNGSASVSITPETPVSIILDANKNAVCEGGNVMFEAKPQFTGGTPTYTWYFNGALVSGSSSTYNATLNESSTINVKVVPVGVVCPSSSELNASKFVSVNKLPIANAGVDSDICENSSVTLGQTAENGVNYSWVSNPVGLTSSHANPTVTPTTTTVYTLVALNSTTGCTNTDNVTVTVNANPTLSILPVVNNRCFSGKDGVISINASGGTPDYSYSLDNGASYSGTSTFNGLDAKKYYARVRDSKGCTAGPTEVEITQPADPFVLSVLNHSNITCFGGSNGFAELKVTQGGKSPFEYSSNGIDWLESNIFTGLSASTNKFFVKDAEECIVEVDNPITQPAQILTTINITNVACKGGNSGKISLSVEGGTGSYTLALTANGKPVETKTNVSKTSEFTGLLAGTYTLTVTDASSCSVVVNEIQILEPINPLQISSITPNQPSCFGYSNGQITVAANGGWDDNYLFNLSGIDNSSGVFSGVASGNYTISVTDNMGCSIDSTYTLEQPQKLVLSADVTNVGCFGASSGVINLSADGGTLNYTFEIGGISGNTKSNLLAGNYTVKVTDANGCVTSKTATVSQPELLKVNLSNWNNGDGDKVCTDTVRVTPQGGTAPYIIVFKDNSTYDCPTDGYLLHSLPNDTYKFTITDSHGCSVEDSATISNLPPPTLALVEAIPASCSYSADGSITVQASSQTGSVSVMWENDFVGNTITGLAGGQYTAVATDKFGCTRTDTFTVGKPDTLIINNAILRSPICYGGADGGVSVTVNGGTSPYSYQWSNGVQTDSTGAVPSGEYTLTVNDDKGCVANKLFTVTDPPSMQPNLPELITLCSNQTYTADAGVPGTSFIWLSNNGFSATTAKVELVLPGEYYLMVTDDNGCTGRDTLRIDSYAGVIDADFLMTDKAFVGDTIVLIEMSWPIPQSIEWVYPVASFSEIFRNEYSVLLIPQQEGNFNIGLVTFAGPCTQYLEKPIIIGPAHPSNGDSKDNLPLFREVVAYPNPNNGNFELFVDMNRESNIMVEVFTMYGKRILLKEHRGLSTYRVPTNINQISGMYLVRVTSGSETRSLRVVIQ